MSLNSESHAVQLKSRNQQLFGGGSLRKVHAGLLEAYLYPFPDTVPPLRTERETQLHHVIIKTVASHD